MPSPLMRRCMRRAHTSREYCALVRLLSLQCCQALPKWQRTTSWSNFDGSSSPKTGYCSVFGPYFSLNTRRNECLGFFSARRP